MIQKTKALSGNTSRENPLIFKKTFVRDFGQTSVFSVPLNKDCDIIAASDIIIEEILRKNMMVGEDCFLPPRFYTNCASRLFYTMENADSGSLLIFLKQTSMILKECGAIYSKDDRILADRKKLTFGNLFSAFWNFNPWNALFPSVPEFADSMQKNKTAILELILSYDEVFSVDRLSRDYCMLTGLKYQNFLLFSSFVDFSVISLLIRFGLLEYVSTDNEVSVRLTKHGRAFLFSLS